MTYHRLICHHLEIGSDMIQIDFQTDSLFASRRACDNCHFWSVSLKPSCLPAQINVSSTIRGLVEALTNWILLGRTLKIALYFPLCITNLNPMRYFEVSLVVYSDVQYILYVLKMSVSACFEGLKYILKPLIWTLEKWIL